MWPGVIGVAVMAGSMRARPDRGSDAWELRVYLGRDASGRVRHRSRSFHGSRRAAERELARLVTEQETQPAVVPDMAARDWGPGTTFNDAIAGWRDNGWADLSPLTAARYGSTWRLHIEKGIGRRRIASTGPYDIEQYFRRLKAQGAGRETVRYVRSVLHRSCRLARKWSGNTLPNPVTDTELPSWSAGELPTPFGRRPLRKSGPYCALRLRSTSGTASGSRSSLLPACAGARPVGCAGWMSMHLAGRS